MQFKSTPQTLPGSRLFAGFNIPEHKAPVASEEMKYLLTSRRISVSQMDCVNALLRLGDGSAMPAGIPESAVLIKHHFLDLVCVCVFAVVTLLTEHAELYMSKRMSEHLRLSFISH